MRTAIPAVVTRWSTPTPVAETNPLLTSSDWLRALWALAWAAFGGNVPLDVLWAAKAAARELHGFGRYGHGRAFRGGRERVAREFQWIANALLAEQGKPATVKVACEFCGPLELSWEARDGLPGRVTVDLQDCIATAFGPWPELLSRRSRRLVAVA